MKKTMIEEILEFSLAEMEANGIEDTTENRLAFLEGLQDGWKEDPDVCIEKTFYQLALTGEIMKLRLRVMFPEMLK